MTAAMGYSELLREIADTARAQGRRGGRPPGTVEPRTQWLRGVIWEMRRSGHGCADTFRRLCLVEDPGPVPRSFRISGDTADELWEEIGGDIRGQEVRWAAFEKLWQRTV
jgi:hypothetical protein